MKTIFGTMLAGALLFALAAQANEYYFTSAKCVLHGSVEELSLGSERALPQQIEFRIKAAWIEGGGRAPVSFSHEILGAASEDAKALSRILTPRSMRYRHYESVCRQAYHGRLDDRCYSTSDSDFFDYHRYDLRMKAVSADDVVTLARYMNRGGKPIALETLATEYGTVNFGKILYGHASSGYYDHSGGNIFEESPQLQLHADLEKYPSLNGQSLHLRVICRTEYDTRQYERYKAVIPVPELSDAQSKDAPPNTAGD